MEPTPAAPLTPTDFPRPEHPRPDFRREPWINLNGRWRFTFDPDNAGEQLRWHRLSHPLTGQRVLDTSGPAAGGDVEDPFVQEIVVPFPWQSRLSGLGA